MSVNRAWSTTVVVVVVAAACIAIAHAATQTYYYNHVTQESRWYDPEHLAPYEDENGRKYWVNAETGESTYESPCEWFEATSEEYDNRVYYVHKETQETSWEQPECLAWVRIVPDYDRDARERTALAEDDEDDEDDEDARERVAQTLDVDLFADEIDGDDIEA